MARRTSHVERRRRLDALTTALHRAEPDDDVVLSDLVIERYEPDRREEAAATIEQWLRGAGYPDNEPDPAAACCQEHALHRFVYWIDGTDDLDSLQRAHRCPQTGPQTSL